MDEVAFCVLGGYGIKAEINLAAYHRVKSLGLLRTSDLPSASEIESALSEPFEIEGKQIRYRSRRPHTNESLGTRFLHPSVSKPRPQPSEYW